MEISLPFQSSPKIVSALQLQRTEKITNLADSLHLLSPPPLTGSILKRRHEMRKSHLTGHGNPENCGYYFWSGIRIIFSKT